MDEHNITESHALILNKAVHDMALKVIGHVTEISLLENRHVTVMFVWTWILIIVLFSILLTVVL